MDHVNSLITARWIIPIEPFGTVLEEANWDFYAIDPMLFSPAEVRLVSTASGRSFHAGGVNPEGLASAVRDHTVEFHVR